MTFKRIYVMQCDCWERSVSNPSRILRCDAMVVAHAGESIIGTKVRSKNEGWVVDAPNAVGTPCHYCPAHAVADIPVRVSA